MNNTWHGRIHRALSSSQFFWIVIGLFLLQAVWLVFSALYPMAFDEAYHFQTIQLYAQQWLPFLAEHPEGTDQLAAVHRYPSYLFHYLLSFPYRLLVLATDNQVTQIIVLRLLNVGMFTGALLLFRRLFRSMGVSPALTNISILFFTLIPIVPLLAAHINYDNLLLLLIAWMLILTRGILTDIRNGNVPVRNLLLLLVVALCSSIVKYAVLPILAVIAVFIVGALYVSFRHRGWTSLANALVRGWRHTRPVLLASLLALVVLSGVLAFERYGVNLVVYSSLVPACDDVIEFEQCLAFGPFERGVHYRELTDPNFIPSRLEHARTWMSGMWYRLFFMINGDVPVDRYHNFSPLPLMALAFTAVFAAGLFAAIRYSRYILEKQPFTTLLAATVIFYSSVLLLSNYASYAEVGRTAALNGRYLLMIFLPLIIIMGLGLSRLLRDKQRLKVLLVISCTVLLLQGGGVLSFIVRSNDTWYWPHPAVEHANHSAQRAISPLIFGSDEEHLNFLPR